MIDCKFSYKQQVIITKGFYKNYKATILSMSKAKDDTIQYNLKLNVDNKTLTISEDCLRSLLFGKF